MLLSSKERASINSGTTGILKTARIYWMATYSFARMPDWPWTSSEVVTEYLHSWDSPGTDVEGKFRSLTFDGQGYTFHHFTWELFLSWWFIFSSYHPVYHVSLSLAIPIITSYILKWFYSRFLRSLVLLINSGLVGKENSLRFYYQHRIEAFKRGYQSKVVSS